MKIHLQLFIDDGKMLLGGESVGATDKHTKIIDIRQVDFTDEATINRELTQFFNAYANDIIENALVITSAGKVYALRGNEATVNPGIINRNELTGSIVIHNHPPDWPDSFGRMDFASFFAYGFSREDVVSKNLWNTMCYNGPLITVEQAVQLYNCAFNNVRSKALNMHMQIKQEQLETMRELSKTMKGLIFNERT